MALCPSTTNWVENQIRPTGAGAAAIGCLQGSLRGGQRAAAVMTPSRQSAKLNRHDPYAYLEGCDWPRLPTQKNNATRQSYCPWLETGHTLTRCEAGRVWRAFFESWTRCQLWSSGDMPREIDERKGRP